VIEKNGALDRVMHAPGAHRFCIIAARREGFDEKVNAAVLLVRE
jgi:hypothetical protein